MLKETCYLFFESSLMLLENKNECKQEQCNSREWWRSEVLSVCHQLMKLDFFSSFHLSSHLFVLRAPQNWNDLLTPVRTAESLSSECRRLKTHLFKKYLTSSSSSSITLPSLVSSSCPSPYSKHENPHLFSSDTLPLTNHLTSGPGNTSLWTGCIYRL